MTIENASDDVNKPETGDVDRTDTQSTQSNPATTKNEPRNRKPRWGRRIAILILLFVVLVFGLIAAAPWIASQPQARDTILGFVNDSISGEMKFDRLSLSWFDNIELGGVTIVDADNEEVLSADRVYLGSGIATVIRDPGRFAELRIEKPDIHLRMDENDRPTLARVFAGKPAPQPSTTNVATGESTSLPEIVGKIIITDGRVRVTPQVGPTKSITGIHADVDLQSLDAIHGTLGFTMDGGSVAAKANVDNLTENGQFNVCKASGKLNVTTDGELDLGPLLAMVMPDRPVTGKGVLTIDAEFKPDASKAIVDARVWNVQMADAAQSGGEPLEATCKGDFTLAGTKLDGTIDLNGTPGDANVKLVADTDQEMPSISADDIFAALFQGKDIALPDFVLVAKSRIDLAQVDRALPGILEFQPGQSIRNGVIDVEQLAVRGGKTPTVEANASLTGASVSRGGAANPIAPMHIALDAVLEASSGLNVNQLDVQSGFGTINASGTPRDLTCKFGGDLASAKRELGPFVDLSNVEMSGHVDGTAKLERTSDGMVAVETNVNAKQTQFRVGDKTFDLAQSTISQKGEVGLVDDKPTRYRAEQLRIDLDQQIVVAGTGSYDFESQQFAADLAVERGDLQFVARRADMLGAPDLKRFAGLLTGNMSVRGGGEGGIETTGQLNASQLTKDGRPVLRDKLDVTWRDVAYSNGGEKLKIALASLNSAEATVNITDANFDLAGGDTANGTIKADANLQSVFEAIARLTDAEKPPALKGTLKLDGDIGKSSKGFQLSAGGGISQLEIGEGAGAVREEMVAVNLNAEIDPTKKTMVFGTNKLTSGLLNAEFAGKIDRYDEELVADLDGEYSTQWNAISKLLQELSPDTAKLVQINGTSRSRFSIDGPLNRKSDNPAYRGATAAIAVGWDAANIVGVDLGKANIDVRLEKGELVVAPTTIAAAQGRINLASRYDLGNSTLRIPGRVATLDGVKLTPQLARELLSRINPIFYHVVSAEGGVNLTVNDLVLPMNEKPTGGKGDGKLELKNAKIEPGGIMGELISMGLAMQTGEKISVGLEGADFQVHDGRIHYENFALIFPYEFDLRFRGSVGLNDSVDLVVSIPVRPELLQRLGVKGPVAQYASVLAGSRIDIPMTGTRENPKLELSKVATDGLVKEAVKRMAGQGPGEILKGIPGLGGSQGKGKEDGKDGGKKKKKKGIGGIIPGIGG